MEDDTPLIALREQFQKEYDRCLHLSQHPAETPEIFGVSIDQVIYYYRWRAEAIGFCIDKINVRLRD